MKMRKKTYMTTVALVFLAIAVLHGLRLYLGWEGIIGGWEVPRWLSWGAVAVAGYLSWQGFAHRR